jgi:hypothetical protein
MTGKGREATRNALKEVCYGSDDGERKDKQ